MEISVDKMLQCKERVRKVKPLVHSITNYITANDCANVLHACGAAPIMSHHKLEVDEVQENCDALVLNFGAIEHFDAMLIAAQAAKRNGHPIVVDPVGVSGNSYRRNSLIDLMNVVKPTCIRGNLSEIRALAENRKTALGLEASDEDMAVFANKDANDGADETVKFLAQKQGCIVIASGIVDIISDGKDVCHITGGDEMFSRITGAGCMATVLVAAFLASAPENNRDGTSLMESAASACKMMAICGERAAKKAKSEGAGTMTFRMKLIDEMSLM